MHPAIAQITALALAIERKDYIWQDYVRAVEKFHIEQNSPSIATTAEILSQSTISVTIALQVAKALDDPKIKSCRSMNAAYKILRRRRDKSLEQQLDLFDVFVKTAWVK